MIWLDCLVSWDQHSFFLGIHQLLMRHIHVKPLTSGGCLSTIGAQLVQWEYTSGFFLTRDQNALAEWKLAYLASLVEEKLLLDVNLTVAVRGIVFSRCEVEKRPFWGGRI